MINGGILSGHRVSLGSHGDHMIHDVIQTEVITEVQDIKQVLLDTVQYR